MAGVAGVAGTTVGAGVGARDWAVFYVVAFAYYTFPVTVFLAYYAFVATVFLAY